MGFALLIAAYKPDMALLKKAILSCSKSMKRIYMFDNTEASTEETAVQDLANITHISFHKNIDFSSAINIGMSKAWDDGIGLVLSLNLGGFFSSAPIEIYKKYLFLSNVAILSPKRSIFKRNDSPSQESKIVAFTQTSKGLPCIKAFRKSDLFNKNLSADVSDNNYYFHIHEQGLCICQINSVIFNHNPVTPKTVGLWGKALSCHPFKRNSFSLYNFLYIEDTSHKSSYYWRTRINPFIKMNVFRDKQRKISRVQREFTSEI